ncbi:MAG: DUF4157 domain-containing protein [Anaerolineae bacterium]|nr:DUF4157 domain-containing protein [Anaerolineae bacterium]
MADQKRSLPPSKGATRTRRKPRDAQVTALPPLPTLEPAALQRAVAHPNAAPPRDILALQRAAGNQAVTRLIQAKLSVGPVGDTYEQEADRVADQVMGMPAPAVPTLQRQEEEEELQMKPLAASITPVVQRQEDEEELQLKPLVQRQEDEEELQLKPLVQRQEDEEELQLKPLVQRQEDEEEELIQLKPLVQRQEDEEELQLKPLVQRQEDEEELQLKPIVQRTAGEGGFEVGGSVERTLASRQGSGASLPDDVRGFMEPRFGTDFSTVRIHSDGEAGRLSRTLQAKAFTHGQDIYFGTGQYNPGTAAGKRLLAHELTHVVQQSGHNKIQRWGTVGGGTSHETVTEEAFAGVDGYSKQAKEYLINMSEAMDMRGSFWLGLAVGISKQKLSSIATDPEAYDNLIGYSRPKDESPKHGEAGQYKTDGATTDVAFIGSMIDRAKNAWDANNRTQALTMIGLALHAAEDRGAHGDGRPGEGHDPRRSIRPPAGAHLTQYYTEGWDNTDCDKKSKNPEGYVLGVQYGHDVLVRFRDYVAEKEKAGGATGRLEQFDKSLMGAKRGWRKFKTFFGAGWASEERKGEKPISELSPDERITKMMGVEKLEQEEALTLDLYIMQSIATGKLTPEERIAVIRKGRPLPINTVMAFMTKNIATITPKERAALIDLGKAGPELVEYLRTSAATLSVVERDAILRHPDLFQQLGPQYTANLAKAPDLMPAEKATLRQEDWEARGKAIAADPEKLKQEKAKGKLQWWVDEEQTPSSETSLAGIRQILEQVTGSKGTTTETGPETPSKETSLAGIVKSLSGLPQQKGTSPTTPSQQSGPPTITLHLGGLHYKWLRPNEGGKGYTVVETVTDGNCQFDAISKALEYAGKGKHSISVLRKIVAGVLRSKDSWKSRVHIDIMNSLENRTGLSGSFKRKLDQAIERHKDDQLEDEARNQLVASELIEDYIASVEKESDMWGSELTIRAIESHFDVVVTVRGKGGG